MSETYYSSDCPPFSVVIPLYNKRPFIRRSVDSVLAQTFIDFELIVVDDGSTDDSCEALADLSDPRCRLVRQNNAGEGAARNRGVAEARAEWVAFLDADDSWLPEHIAEIASVIDAFPNSGLVATGSREVSDAADLAIVPQGSSNIRKLDYFLEASRRIGRVNASNVAIRRIAFTKHGGFGKFKAGADLECWARLALHYPVALSDRVTSIYIRGTGGVMEQLQQSTKKSTSVRVSTLEDISPSVATLCRALDNDSRLKADAGIRAYINSRVYGCICGALYRNEVEEARRLVTFLTPPVSPKLAMVATTLSLPHSWIHLGLSLLRTSKSVFRETLTAGRIRVEIQREFTTREMPHTVSSKGAPLQEVAQIKVAQILYSGLGGHGSVAFSLIDADVNKRWRPAMGFIGVEPVLPAYVKTCEHHGIEFVFFPALSGSPWRLWPRIYKWLCDSRPEAIILHSPPTFLPCLLFAIRRRALLIVVEHQPNSLKRRADWFFSALLMRFSHRVVALTASYNQELAAALGVFYRPRNVSIIPNGVDVARFMPSPRRRAFGRRAELGMAGRFTRMKRQDVLVEMIEELRRLEPDIDWRLNLAGSGETWDAVSEMVGAKALDSHVDLPGPLEEAALARWLQSLDIYLHASEGETLSTSMLQAMASELPIVGSNVPGIAELIGSDIRCGLLVDDQDPRGFAMAVISLVKDPARAAELGASGRQLCLRDYTNVQMFEKYNEIIRDRYMKHADERALGRPMPHMRSSKAGKFSGKGD